MDHFKLLEMLESQIILVVSTHAMKGVYTYINAQMKSLDSTRQFYKYTKKKGNHLHVH